MTVSSGTAKSRKYPLWLRLVGFVCVLLTAWHIFATFLWVAPSNEIRKIVPDNALRNYMMPMFGQSWSVFAPKPVDGDYSFEVRASIVDDAGEERTTAWIDPVKREMDMIHHNLFPPRAALAGDRLSSVYQNSWRKLNDNQQESVELSYFKGDDWTQRMTNRLNSQITKNSSNSKNRTADFLVAEKQASAYATQVAKAVWGDEEITRIQFRAGRQGVIPFSQRNDENAKRPKPVTIESGWRGMTVMDGQSQENFAEVFNSLEGVNAGK